MSDWQSVAREFGIKGLAGYHNMDAIQRMAEEIDALRGQLPTKRKGPKSSKDFAHSLQFHKELTEMQKKEMQAMQAEIVRLREEFQQMAAIATKQKMRIDWLEGSLHTCHDNCQKAGCIALREREYSAKLREALVFYGDWATRSYQEKDYPHNRFGFVQYDVHAELMAALALPKPGGEK